MSPLKPFITSVSWNVSGKIGIQALYFVLSILITRHLGRESLGVYATLLVIPAFLRLINSLGLEMALHKVLSELRVDDPGESRGRWLLRRVIGLRLLSTGALSAVLYAGLPAYGRWMDLPGLVDYRIDLLLYFAVVTLNSLLGAVFMAYLDYRTITLGEGLNAALNLAFLWLFIDMDAGIHGVLFAYILSSAVNLVYYSARVRGHVLGDARATGLEEIRSLSATLYLVSLIGFALLTQTDVLFMNLFKVPSSAIGYYHLTTGLGAMLTFVLTGIGPLAQSLFAGVYAREGPDGLSTAWVLVSGFAVFLSAPVFAFAIAHAGELVSFIYGAAFAPAGAMLALYALFLAVQLGLGSEFNGWALVTAGKKSAVLRFSVEASLVNVLLDILWIPRWAEWGAVAATGCTLVFLTLRQLMALRQVIRTHRLYPLTGKYASVAILALIPGQMAGLAGLDGLGWSAVLYSLTFLAALIWIKPLSRPQYQALTDLFPPLAGCFQWFSRRG